MRPGRRSALSMVSGRDVVARTMTGSKTSLFKPSISMSNCERTRSVCQRRKRPIIEAKETCYY
jgi:hypothetical protein